MEDLVFDYVLGRMHFTVPAPIQAIKMDVPNCKTGFGGFLLPTNIYLKTKAIFTIHYQYVLMIVFLFYNECTKTNNDHHNAFIHVSA